MTRSEVPRGGAGLVGRAADGVADVGVHDVLIGRERRQAADNGQKDQAYDQAVFDRRGAAVVGDQTPEDQSKSRSQATSGSSAGGIG